MLRRVRLAVPVLVTFGMSSLSTYAQDSLPAGPAGTTVPNTGEEKLVLPEEPKTPDELVRATILTLKLARPELARRYVEALVKMEPDDETLLTLRDQYGTSLFLQLSRNKDLQPASTDLIQMLTRAANRATANPARIESLLKQLGGSARERELAIAELQHFGPYAVGPIVKLMDSPLPQEQLNDLAVVLTRLGPSATPPVAAMLQSTRLNHQALAADVLGVIGDKNDALPLLVAAFSPTSPKPVQVSARQALAKIMYGDPLKANRLSGDNLAGRLLQRSVDLMTGKVKLPENDEGKVSIWIWNESEGVPEESFVSPTSAILFRAEQLTRQALEFQPENREIQAELLSLLLLRDQQSSGWDKPVPEGPETAHNLLLTAGPELAMQVLTLGLEQNNVAAATGALRVLAQSGSRRLLAPGATGKSPVVAALDASNPRVRFAAATTILNWDPTETFPAAGRVVQILARALNSDSVPNMVVVDPNSARGDEIRSLMAAIGFEATRVGTGAEGFDLAASHGDTAVAVLHLNTVRPELTHTLASFRADSRTANIPIIIYGPAEMRSVADRYITEFTRVSYLQEASTAGELRAQLNPFLASLTPPPLTSEQQVEQTRAAAFWLRHIAEGQRTHVFHLEPAEDALTLSIAKPDIGGDVLTALAAIGTATAQQTLYTSAINPNLTPELRSTAARNLAFHIQKYGLTLSNDEVASVYRTYEGESIPAVKSAFAGILGTLRPETKTVSERIRSYPVSVRPLP